MNSPSPVLLVIAVLFLSTFVRSALSFGSALIAMPLLTLIISVQIATPLVAFVTTTIALMILLKDWRSVDAKIAWRLIVSTMIGIPVGLFFLKTMPESIVKAVLGIVLVVFGLYNLIKPRLLTIQSSRLAYAFGLIAGVLGGAYNAFGPPVIAYGVLCGWSPKRFRATLQSHSIPTYIMILVGHGLAGLWTFEVVQLYIYALPIIILAIFLGDKFSTVLSGDQYNRIINVFLVMLGALLFV